MGPVLAHLSLLRPEYSASSWKARPAPPEVGGGSLTRIPPGLGCWIEGPWPRSLQRANVTNMVATSLQNGSKMAPTWCQHGCQMGPGGVLEASWRPLGALKKAWSAKEGLPGAYGALLDASWGALGAEKSNLERLLAAPRGIPRQVSAILGAKKAPEREAKSPKSSPRGFPSSKRDSVKKYNNFSCTCL